MSDIQLKDEFDRQHAVVKKGFETALEVARALQNIRDGKLYKAVGYRNFSDYVNTEHDFSDRYARHLITGAEITTEHDVPNMRVARALSRVPEEDRASVLAEAKSRMGEEVTSTMIQDIQSERTVEVIDPPQNEESKSDDGLEEFRSIVSDLMRVGMKIKDLSEQDAGAFLDLGQLRASMQTAMDYVKAAVPTHKCICTNGCKLCKNTGRLTETMWKALPEEMRR